MREAAQLGFARCLMPAGSIAPRDVPAGLEAVGVGTVAEALDMLIRQP
jgi:DNA repair protein RadA/Sms